MLGTLGLLVTKAGTALKPFVPQLQTIFLKCLIDAVCPIFSYPVKHVYAPKYL